ncbi:peptidase family M49-domain-containing protein [Baffinella frigidus]|nr:peptidase family M49-domain-containing protein [Cryptophyta sp. CCMP2293]
MAPTAEEELFLTPLKTPICLLDAKEAFEGLSADEKRYAHHLTQAFPPIRAHPGCWAGALACLAQCSPESPKLFLLLFKLFTADTPAVLQEASGKAGVPEVEFEAFLQFASVFFGNMGNYLSFGDTKFVPRCEAMSIASIITASSDKTLSAEWDAISTAVFDLSPGVKQMGLEGNGISTYYSPGITEAEIKVVQDFLQSQNLGDQAYNTRLFKDGGVYKLAVASAEVKPSVTHDFNGTKIEVVYGDHAPFMKVLADSIAEAIKSAGNPVLADSIAQAIKSAPAEREHQVEMLKQYVNAFEGGDINAHKYVNIFEGGDINVHKV